MNRLLIIPAAGLGTRLSSSVPKVLYPVNGKPMLRHLIELYRNFVDRFVIIVHPSSEREVRIHCRETGDLIEIVTQEGPTGMLDAILTPRKMVERLAPEEVWITWCDQIAVCPSSIRRVARKAQEESDWSCIFPSFEKHGPYIHLVRDREGRITDVLQKREGDPMPDFGENDMGLFCLTREAYGKSLPEFAAQTEPGRLTGETNFLPFLAWLSRRETVISVLGTEEVETVGINTPDELKTVETALRLRTGTLSIIIPAYNEERYIGPLLDKVLAVDLTEFHLNKEVIVIDDCSTDRTSEIVRQNPEVKLGRLSRNSGKGEAVKAGMTLSGGDLILIQDADLEYDPEDYVPMIRAMKTGVDAVYGTRYRKYPRRGEWLNLPLSKHSNQSWPAYLGGKSLSLIAFLFTGRYLTDTVTALKLFRSEVVLFLNLQTTGFELDHEITAKLLARGRQIVEVPIRYYPRSRAEGKKIGLRDWFKGVRTFSRYGKW